jgi:DNA processing protein
MNVLLPLHFYKGAINKVKKTYVSHYFDDPNALKANINNLLRLHKDGVRLWEEAQELALKETEIAVREGLNILCLNDVDNFPEHLHEIPDPPMVLFGRGRWNNAKVPLSMVGSRKATNYGLHATRQMVLELSRYPVNLVSGLALGVDGQMHRAALENGATTTAFIAGGMGELSPKSHQQIADELVASGGGYFTEQPFYQPSLRQMYPVRNRLIAGASLATVVVEAARRSGAMITANQAVGYNRELFALPGAHFQPMSEGPNALIHERKASSIFDYSKFPGEFYPIWQSAQGEIDFSQGIESRILREFPHGRKVNVYHLMKTHKDHKSQIFKALRFLVEVGAIDKIGPNMYCRKSPVTE